MTEQLRIFAGLQGFVSAAGLLALVLFFALATPFGTEQRRWSWFGPVNDWLYVLGAAPWIVATVLLVVRVRGGAWLWVYSLLVCALIAAGAVITVLMLAGRVGLGAQTLVAVPMTIAGIVWLWPAAAAAVSAAAVPGWMLPLSIAIIAAFAVGGGIVAAAFAVSEGSTLRMALFVVGGIPVACAMVANPTWWILLASNVR